jgi:hypothetical protein
MRVYLDKLTHRYYDTEGNFYKSVTTFINELFPKFDADKMAGFVAKKRGVSKSEVLAEWENKTKQGTNIHAQLESEIFFQGGAYFKNTFLPLLENVEELKEKEAGLLNEVIIFDTKLKLAGTSDLILKHENTVYIIDFKSNLDMSTYYKIYPNKTKIEGIENCKHHRYSLQLTIYKHLFKALYNESINIRCFISPVIDQLGINDVLNNTEGLIEAKDFSNKIVNIFSYI